MKCYQLRHDQWLEFIAHWDFRVNHGGLVSLGLFFTFPLFAGFLKSWDTWWADKDSPFPYGCASPVFLLRLDFSVVVWVDCWLVVHAEAERMKGSTCPSDHVRSVWTGTEWLRMGMLLVPTTAAAEWFPGMELLWPSALTILRASANEMFLSAFTCCTLFKYPLIFKQLLLKAEWFPVQFAHFSCWNNADLNVIINVFRLPPVVFNCDIEDVTDPLGLQFFNNLFPITVNKWSTLSDSYAGIECSVWAGCHRAASQVVHFVDDMTERQ